MSTHAASVSGLPHLGKVCTQKLGESQNELASACRLLLSDMVGARDGQSVKQVVDQL